MFFFFFFNDTATTEIYTLSLHDALPISRLRLRRERRSDSTAAAPAHRGRRRAARRARASPGDARERLRQGEPPLVQRPAHDRAREPRVGRASQIVEPRDAPRDNHVETERRNGARADQG